MKLSELGHFNKLRKRIFGTRPLIVITAELRARHNKHLFKFGTLKLIILVWYQIWEGRITSCQGKHVYVFNLELQVWKLNWMTSSFLTQEARENVLGGWGGVQEEALLRAGGCWVWSRWTWEARNVTLQKHSDSCNGYAVMTKNRGIR